MKIHPCRGPIDHRRPPLADEHLTAKGRPKNGDGLCRKWPLIEEAKGAGRRPWVFR